MQFSSTAIQNFWVRYSTRVEDRWTQWSTGQVTKRCHLYYFSYKLPLHNNWFHINSPSPSSKQPGEGKAYKDLRPTQERHQKQSTQNTAVLYFQLAGSGGFCRHRPGEETSMNLLGKSCLTGTRHLGQKSLSLCMFWGQQTWNWLLSSEGTTRRLLSSCQVMKFKGMDFNQEQTKWYCLVESLYSSNQTQPPGAYNPP